MFGVGGKASFVDSVRDRWLDVVDWYNDEYARPSHKVVTAAGVVAAMVACLTIIWLWQNGPDSGSEDSGSAPGESSEFGEPISSPDGDPVETSDDGRESASDVDATISTSAVPSDSVSAGEASVPSVVDSGATPASVPVESSGAETAPSTLDAGGSPAGDAAPFPSSPDGAPLPLVVVFDTETITISGQVPSQAAKDRLSALAVANSQFPDAVVVDNMVVNPAVPISVGARIIELNSARFPEGTAEIRPDHARELDRVANVMNALPNVSVLVIGHADQRGDDVANFAISDERARAVVNYLIFLGIAPSRLASRAAGESDLLTLDDDEAALALNRRTEFIFGGLLIE